MTVREVEGWRDVRLVCGITHQYHGRLRWVQIQGFDMDGDSFWYPPSKEFDPDRCVVCGLKTWDTIPSQNLDTQRQKVETVTRC